MSQQRAPSALTYAAWANAFSAEDVARIERHADGLPSNKAAQAGSPEEKTSAGIRAGKFVTRTGLALTTWPSLIQSALALPANRRHHRR